LFPALSSEAVIALTRKAKDSDGVQHSGAQLSARERAIVLLMGHGLTNKRSARQLSIAPETVKSHAKRIFWKAAVQTRAQAVYGASALGLIASPVPPRGLTVSRIRKSLGGEKDISSAGHNNHPQVSFFG
jgi:DNA-binding CsgD family transcriptional regulator